MIRDATVLAEIQQNWAGVEALRAKLQRSAFATFSMPTIGGIFPFALADAAHNLPFIHAYAVLNDALKQLRDEGHFACNCFFLGALLKASQNVLAWRDFALISQGVTRRNEVAHRGQLLNRADCWKYVDAVKVELSALGII